MDYQAKLKTPFGMVGISCTADALSGLAFLTPDTRPMSPQNPLAREVYKQLTAYFADPDFQFDLPLQPGGTAHQNKVWRAMCAIPRGKTRSYGDVATQLGSAPRAVGQACGNNPIAIIIPCHRIVGKAGLGGFMHHDAGFALDIKRWLLEHESILKPGRVVMQTARSAQAQLL